MRDLRVLLDWTNIYLLDLHSKITENDRKSISDTLTGHISLMILHKYLPLPASGQCVHNTFFAES